MLEHEAFSFWVAVTLYTATAITYLAALVFEKKRWLRIAAFFVAPALLFHGVSIAVHRLAIGFASPTSAYELISVGLWCAFGLFSARQLLFSKGRITVAALLPVGVIALAAGFYLDPQVKLLSPVMRGYWLIIYALFAELAFDALIVSFALALALLLRSTGWLGSRSLVGSLPSVSQLELLSFRFSALGFLLLGVAILAGSIWSNQAWGRYWYWDSTEIWLVFTWLMYGAYLGARIVRRWRGGKSAWFQVAVLSFALFSLLAFPYIQ